MKLKAKRLIALVISVMMIATMLGGLNSFAAGGLTVTLAADDTSYSPGETVTLTLGAEDLVGLTSGVMGFIVDIQYDDAVFTPGTVTLKQNVANGDIDVDTYPENGNTYFRIMYSDYDAIPGGTTPTPVLAGAILEVTFTVNAEAALEDTTLTLTSDGWADYDNTSSAITVVDPAAITVTIEEEVTGPAIELPENYKLTESITAASFDYITGDEIPYTVTNVITGVRPLTAAYENGTTVTDFLADITVNRGTLVFKAVDGVTELGEYDFITNGTTLEVTDGATTTVYTFVIFGDVDSDGMVTSLDYSTMVDWGLGYTNIEGIAILAADLDADTYATSLDYSTMVEYGLGYTDDINQNPFPV